MRAARRHRATAGNEGLRLAKLADQVAATRRSVTPAAVHCNRSAEPVELPSTLVTDRTLLCGRNGSCFGGATSTAAAHCQRFQTIPQEQERLHRELELATGTGH